MDLYYNYIFPGCTSHEVEDEWLLKAARLAMPRQGPVFSCKIPAHLEGQCRNRRLDP